MSLAAAPPDPAADRLPPAKDRRPRALTCSSPTLIVRRLRGTLFPYPAGEALARAMLQGRYGTQTQKERDPRGNDAPPHQEGPTPPPPARWRGEPVVRGLCPGTTLSPKKVARREPSWRL